MVNWYCSSSLCFNNFKSKDKDGNPLKFYRLPSDKNVQSEYQRFFKTTGINWRKGHICAAHWSCGERKTPQDLPDVAVPVAQYELMKIKYERAKKTFDTACDPTTKQKLAYKNAKQKLNTATKIFKNTPLKRISRNLIMKHHIHLQE